MSWAEASPVPAMPASGSDAGPRVSRERLTAVDTLRGLVMLLMVLDHCRDYFHASSFHPRDVTQPVLFLTRWVTHFCAPTFVLLAGVSAYLYGERVQQRSALCRYLWTRGLWLIALELSLVRMGWTFAFASRELILQVIWALGVSMLVLAVLVRLPRGWIAVLAVGMIASHNAFDTIRPRPLGEASWLWTLLHESATLTTQSGWTLWALYPLIPWVGVMAAGYALGPSLKRPPAERQRVLVGLAFTLLSGFVVLRSTNLYGDPGLWTATEDIGESLLAFIDCEKYPPSLLFLCMTLGPALLLLAVFLSRKPSGTAHWLAVVGRVPLFFYLAHIYLLHALALLASWAQRGHTHGLIGVFPPDKSSGFGFPMPVVYALTLLVVCALLPLCHKYAALKRQSGAWWWSYL